VRQGRITSNWIELQQARVGEGGKVRPELPEFMGMLEGGLA